MNVLLPVGISFYIFQALGYSIDVYRGDVEPEKNFFNYALFVSFFPQLVAGPIERSTNLLQQFKTKHQFDGDQAISGVNLMLWGYFLKLVVADRCAIYVDSVYNNMEYQNGGSCLLATLLFSIQIYGDFAGYTYIAIGCSRVMGFNLTSNFQRPYFSSSISDFWRRWHISLSRWLRDYLYIPLGGSRKGKNRTYVNLLATMLVSGIWHGANWTYVVWGLLHGIALCMERVLGINKREWHGICKFIRILATFFIVSIFWVFFRANTLADGVWCTTRIFSNLMVPSLGGMKQLSYAIGGVILTFLIEYIIEYKKVTVNDSNKIRVYSLCSAGLLMAILSWGVFDGGQFIYFQF
jgi:D-alanyl-lipoteichoic acid acyltransferase DltB (MBOAT superfamily)